MKRSWFPLTMAGAVVLALVAVDVVRWINPGGEALAGQLGGKGSGSTGATGGTPPTTGGKGNPPAPPPPGAGLDPRAVIGLSISPLPMDLRGKDPAQVGLGSYLVNTIGNCWDCHTVNPFFPGGDPFQGQPKKFNPATYMVGGRTFTGDNGEVVVSTNLRPTAGTGLPGGDTLDVFLQELRTGIDAHNPGRLLQVAAWPANQNMTDGDLTAMYEYLSALPPAPQH